MQQPLFPNIPFAVVFSTILLGGLVYVAWVDLKTGKIPNRLTVSIFLIGFALNIVRGGWVSGEGHPLWLFDPGNPLWGSLDGVLFALVGFLVGFGFFFLLWIFSVGGPGDVKLVGAVGAWLGYRYVLFAVALSVPFLLLLAILAIGYRLLGGKLPQKSTTSLPGHPEAQRTMTTFGLSFCLGSAVVVLLFFFGYLDYLHTAPPPG
jgi:Flp pilus assembly protein protease CpaA